jgi:hypothetical protein
MIGYKFVRSDLTSYGDFRWEIGKWYETSGEGELFGPGWLHGFFTPEEAEIVILRYCGNEYDTLFEMEYDGKVKIEAGWFGFGATRMRLVREIRRPAFTPDQRTRIAILSAMTVNEGNREIWYTETWLPWAQDWLNGKKNAAITPTVAYIAAFRAVSAHNDVDASAAYAAYYAVCAAYAAYIAAQSLKER